jgi:hypothetical protein
MNKLTPIFIAGALVVAGGLAYAQSQIGEPRQDAAMKHGERIGHGTGDADASPMHGTRGSPQGSELKAGK